MMKDHAPCHHHGIQPNAVLPWENHIAIATLQPFPESGQPQAGRV